MTSVEIGGTGSVTVTTGPVQTVVVTEGSGTAVAVVSEAEAVQEIISTATQVVEVEELGLKGEDGKDGTDGADGAPGPPGPTGPPGASAINPIVFHQDLPATVWHIVHGLNTFPSVTVVDSAGETVLGDVNYLDANTIELAFGAPFSGTAYMI